MASLCVRSEQCTFDIEEKLYKAGLDSAGRTRIISELKAGKFIDDARFARAVARDKVRFSAWGRRKIQAYLISKRIDRAMISDALSAIEPADYKGALVRSAKAKAKNLDLAIRENREKLIRHLASRGFEANLCVKVTDALARKQEEE